MKICPKCNTEIDDVFDMCWNCNHNFAEINVAPVLDNIEQKASIDDNSLCSETDKMKYCPNCNAEIEENFEMCWNCGFSFTENRVIEITDFPAQESKIIECLRCDVPMDFLGNYTLPEGTRIDTSGELVDQFVDLEPLDIYRCSQCRKVEFYSTPI